MRLAFLVLAHDQPENLGRLVTRLTAEGDLVVVHWDSKNAFDIGRHLRETLPERTTRNLRIARQVDVQWGGWSMVEATLACLDEVRAAPEPVDYVILLSGADYPIRPLAHLKAFLAADPGREYMEFVDPELDPWVIKGLSRERYEYRHWVNWRRHPKLFNRLWKIQRGLGLRRRMPAGLKAYFGSQWWALTWNTAGEILRRARSPEIAGFFKTTWVPDEMFFQTMTAALAPIEKIGPFGLTFYHFTPQGRPIVFYNDHFGFLTRQEFFFARKISPHAEALRDELDAHVLREAGQPPPTIGLRKDLDGYDYFSGLQYRGLPNTRVIGKADDPWYGDLEWNRVPYFVILAPDGVDLDGLRQALNRQAGMRCYGELFHPDRIDYDLPGAEHPGYGEDDFLARDLKRPNFLCDVIHHSPDVAVGCVMRIPPHHEMVDVVMYDPRAFLVVCLPSPPGADLDLTEAIWKRGHDFMTTDDRLTKIEKTGKVPVVVTLSDRGLTGGQIEYVAGRLREWIRARHAPD
jgi:hypothetical protein